MVACLAAVLAVSAMLAAVRLVAKEPPRPVVSGQVVGPDGKPLEGAEVVVVASRLPVAIHGVRPADRPSCSGAAVLIDQGRFRIELSG